MTICQITFDGGSYYSSAMWWSNTGAEELESITETAQRHAARYGYTVCAVREITEREAQSNINRGMSYSHIDEQAERDHDPSMKKETETQEPAQEIDEDDIDEAVAEQIERENESRKPAEREALDRINANLRKGMIYAEELVNVRFPCWWYVLMFDPVKKLFRWRHYGGSANKATKKNLLWVIVDIFNMTPSEFERRYTALTPEEYNREPTRTA